MFLVIVSIIVLTIAVYIVSFCKSYYTQGGTKLGGAQQILIMMLVLSFFLLNVIAFLIPNFRMS